MIQEHNGVFLWQAAGYKVAKDTISHWFFSKLSSSCLD